MLEKNQALAAIFRHMADTLAAKQANPHRVRAYRRAALVLSQLQEGVEGLAGGDRLQELPGIGKELSAKIREYLETGTIQAYEELKNPLPPDVAEWTKLPGLTEPIVQHLYFRLRMQSLEDVAALAQSHMLRTLPGFSGDETALLNAIRERTSRPSD
jgi:DNA polymerase (family 10)